MYNGYTESAEKIAERKAQILKGYEPVQPEPAVTMVTAKLPALTLAQWYRLPAIVRHFHSWERASQPLVIDPETKHALEPDQGGAVKLRPPGR